MFNREFAAILRNSRNTSATLVAIIKHLNCETLHYVGRGAQFVLPRERGLRVRIVAPLDYRVQQIMERRHLSFEEARDYVAKTDAGRQDFVRQYFHHDVPDPHLFDFVVNVEKLGPERAAHLIVDALASCFDAHRSP
jgi:cytidylate kinase